MFKRKNDDRDKKIQMLEERIQMMSEIITDFERNEFKVVADKNCTMITNTKWDHPSATHVEVNVKSTKNFSTDGVFDGKEIRFTLNHPRTYR